MAKRTGVLVLVCMVTLWAVDFCPRLRLLLTARSYGRMKTLEMPVVGLGSADVRSTWHAPRPGGRRHEGVDLFARRGTPVLSASRGVIWRVGTDPLGGRVVTVLGEGPALYYYAHLDDWANGLHVGQQVNRGTHLGVVGTSGNARFTPPHLHFGVYRLSLFRIRAVDPTPLLRGRRSRAVRAL